jgi:hypothetical protein
MTDVQPLVLKPRRRMIQPTKDELRRRLSVAQARILSLEAQVAALTTQRPVRAFLLRIRGMLPTKKD